MIMAMAEHIRLCQVRLKRFLLVLSINDSVAFSFRKFCISSRVNQHFSGCSTRHTKSCKPRRHYKVSHQNIWSRFGLQRFIFNLQRATNNCDSQRINRAWLQHRRRRRWPGSLYKPQFVLHGLFDVNACYFFPNPSNCVLPNLWWNLIASIARLLCSRFMRNSRAFTCRSFLLVDRLMRAAS